VLPLQFLGSRLGAIARLKGDETIDVMLPADIKPQQELQLKTAKPDGNEKTITVKSRIDTATRSTTTIRGILPFVLRELLGSAGEGRRAPA